MPHTFTSPETPGAHSTKSQLKMNLVCSLPAGEDENVMFECVCYCRV